MNKSAKILNRFLLGFMLIFSYTASCGQSINTLLVYPSNNACLADSNVCFSWNSIAGADYYELQFSDNPSFTSILFTDSSLSTSKTIPINYDIKYFYRIRTNTSGIYSNWSNTRNIFVLEISTLSGNSIWLKADSGVFTSSDTIYKWHNIIDTTKNAVQTNIIKRPKLIPHSAVINEMPAIQFDGVDDFLTIDSSFTISEVFAFFSWGDTSQSVFPNYNGLLSADNAAVKVFMFIGNINTSNIYNAGGSVFGNNIRINGVQSLDYSPLSKYKITHGYSSTPRIFTKFYIGAERNQVDRFWKGELAEILMFDTIVPDTTRDKIYEYLQFKYAPPVNLGININIEHSFCDTIIYAGNRFTDYIWNTGDTSSSISVSSSGLYWCEATDIFGRISRDTILVQFPFNALPDTAFCLTDTVSMNTGLDHAYSFQWNDASSDSLLDVFAPGEYWVEVTDSTIGACSVRDTFVVAVDSFPVLASLGPDTSLCAGDRYSLQSELGAGYSYNWSTGSSDSAIVISAPGSYSLTVTNYNVCTAIDTVNITTKGIKPVAVFSNGTVCFGDSTNFVDMSYTLAPDGINNILFDFNDGDSSTASNPYHTFTSNGDFMVTLEVISDSGCYADTTISVHVRNLPTADFLPFNGCNGKLINFSDSSDEAEGSIALWEWDFGDGNTSTQQDPTHIYDSVNVYNTTLIISDIYGCSDTVIYPVNVRLTPIVDFDYEESCLGQKTYFTELTNNPTYSPIIYRQWAFGDGNYSFYENPQHVYGAVGTYNVLLINKSINGCIDSVEKTITVHPFPIAGFISDTACKNKEVCFIDTSSVQYSSIVLRQWNFDVAGTNTGDSIACTSFPDEGVFPVQLIVTSEYGCTSSVTKQIIVHPNPVADFSVIPEYGVPPLDVQFFNYTSGADTWYWLFGDGGNSSSENPAHTYTTENIFEVYLIAENEFTCTDTAYGNVYVIPSQLDLVLNNITVKDSGGYYYLSIEFFNNGTRNIKDIAFDARIGSNIPVHESWSNLLLPGEQSFYTFTAAFLKPDNENIRTICVEGTVLDAYGQEDETPEDNTICYSLIDEFFIASVYPSPADDYITVNIFLPDDGDLNLIINTEDGKIVREGSFFDLDKGTLRTRINVQNLAGGMYIIRAKYLDKEDMIKFVKE